MNSFLAFHPDAVHTSGCVNAAATARASNYPIQSGKYSDTS
jgi:hypothetical protein